MIRLVIPACTVMPHFLPYPFTMYFGGSDKVNASLSITIAVFFFVAALFIKRSSSPLATMVMR